jgi:hypothetical protein
MTSIPEIDRGPKPHEKIDADEYASLFDFEEE